MRKALEQNSFLENEEKNRFPIFFVAAPIAGKE
jgi:hypothetical protein